MDCVSPYHCVYVCVCFAFLGGGDSGFRAHYVKVQCHISFQTEAGEMPKASLEISTDRAKTLREEQHVLTATRHHGDRGSDKLTSQFH